MIRARSSEGAVRPTSGHFEIVPFVYSAVSAVCDGFGASYSYNSSHFTTLKNPFTEKIFRPSRFHSRELLMVPSDYSNDVANEYGEQSADFLPADPWARRNR